MNLSINLKINQNIEIIDDEVTYKSIVQDINKDGMCISYPIHHNKPLLIHSGSVIEFYVTTERDIVKCKSVVLGKKREENINLLVLSLPEVIERVQRREYFRLPITMPIRYYGLPKDRIYTSLRDVPSGYFSRLINSVSLDISGGGIKIVSNEIHNPGEYVIISINIPQEINILCSVVRIENTEEKNKFKLALKYEGIEEKTRDKIIQFIFNKLREQSKLLR
ncbi:flagellar brake protein [Caloramator sp. ALD01]|uniref:flagellar brake protein n=1 Tax=Caloramator sp. ALD01 TaxID=1031288 RepID=UPI00042177BA|nr:PilZ domain-containing protein [Caloramator sp. ALD01]